ncbi:MAG TPA: RNA polymerase Rpb4 family protein [Candidatus Acidoferrales bacterium]|nr:RNA polymerase Rpb4 family protein [Candidatus Acidoferrales bacterium]
MIVKAVLGEENLTLSEVKDILVELKTSSPEEEPYEFRRALDHVTTFAKLTAEQSRQLVDTLKRLEKMKEEIAIRIADIIPLSKDEVRSIYAKERFSLTEAELDEILDIIARFY